MNFDILKTKKNIKIVGHPLADFDSMASGVLLEYVLKEIDIKSEYILQDGYCDPFFIETAGKLGIKTEFNSIIRDDDVLFLVDHTGKYSNDVVACFDHHPMLYMTTENYLNEEKTSCAKVIYDYALSKGLNISKEYKLLTMYSCFLDSMSFLSSKARPEDKVWCDSVIKEYNLNEKEIIMYGYGLTDKNQPFGEYIRTGIKTYDVGNKKIKASYIVTAGETVDTEKVNVELQKSLDDETIAWIFAVSDVTGGTKQIEYVSKEYHITVSSEKMLSRGKDIMPFVIRYMEAENDGTATKILIERKQQIATMESCTSGSIASSITDYEGASAVLKGSKITYSNIEKIKAGVPEETIDTFGVYSRRTADAMAENAKSYYNSDIGVGITGSFSNVDPANPDSVAGEVYFSIKSDYADLSRAKLVYHNLDLSRKDIKKKTVDIVIKALTALLTKQQ